MCQMPVDAYTEDAPGLGASRVGLTVTGREKNGWYKTVRQEENE